ncbi:glycerol kinase [Lipomyces tetrasporus]|uniref:glycerol kinase n=1 Tax=Lipomyces tetrasporus TaxID=54092 RepID=A0AAD7QQD8_9ASCO|nr:glycerol kinase [Lipomyces tetrasporus]KAJ8099559.1 glycerol kinase [Lipomyces tetrasporus]
MDELGSDKERNAYPMGSGLGRGGGVEGTYAERLDTRCLLPRIFKVGHSFVGSIDQGTTSSRFLIFNEIGEVVASHQLEFTQIYPQPGWHEHDPLEIVESVEKCIDGAVASFQAKGHRIDAKAVGITNQRETTVVWNKETGKPLYNGIVWTDTRTQALVRKLKEHDGHEKLQSLCGLPLSTYPSVGKLLWLIENVPRVRDAYDNRTLAFGTIDTWLIYRLNGATARNVFVTDPSNASRNMFMNIHTLQYDSALLDFFHLNPIQVYLPAIIHSSDPSRFGSLATTSLAITPITGCLGDQSAALVGQKGFTAGQAKNTYGTGCFLLYNVGSDPVISTHNLLTTVAFDFQGQDNFQFIGDSSQISALAETVEDNGGCVFVTAFSGLFAPYWIDDARGTILGITTYTKRGHIARATLEATCFQTKAILDSMERDSGHKLKELAVDGGMCNSELAMQTQADIICIPVNRPIMRETTALGAAIAAGLAVGVWSSVQDVEHINTEGRTTFAPTMTKDKAESIMFALWERAVNLSRGWTN